MNALMALGQWLASGYPVPAFPRSPAGEGQVKEGRAQPADNGARSAPYDTPQTGERHVLPPLRLTRGRVGEGVRGR